VVVLNKPFDVVCRFTLPANAKAGTRTLAEFVHEPGLYPAGLLDRDSEGLVVLTNDGALQHRLTDPRHGHERTYLAQVEGVPSDAALVRLTDGSIVIDGVPCRPAGCRSIAEPTWLWPREPPVRHRVQVPTSWVELVLTEGRNRQVRRMTAAIGHPTLRLVRVAMAGLSLADLAPGQWRMDWVLDA
jgi:23S rRNA pseudouridine2457 synthase